MTALKPDLRDIAARLVVAADILDRKPSEVYGLNQLCRDTAEALRAFPAWQPIETAPKDGTLVDLLYAYPRGRTINCRWTDDLEIGWHWLTPKWDKGELLPESEWFTNTYPNMQPTHWMPSPAPPTEGEG